MAPPSIIYCFNFTFLIRYCYNFPFLDEEETGMRFKGLRHTTPLYQHLLHARRPSLGFIGIPLAVPCPIPFFETQAAARLGCRLPC